MTPAAIPCEGEEAIGRRLGDNDEVERLLDVKRGTVKLIKKGDAGRAGSFLTR